ncbi:MAG: alkene reductase [Prochloraceae cyanobacterium]
MNQNKDLFTPVRVGAYQLQNRIVMAPLTRCRAGEGNIPQPINVTYYQQRATAGLIITEATQVSPQGQGYPYTPGIHSSEQVEGWKSITKAVRDRGGKIFLQLWHVGRVSHPCFQPNNELPVAPSAIAPEGMANTFSGERPFVTPRALKIEEIPEIIEQYRNAAKNALKAGFNGVEIHSANGYLLDQFLHDSSNKRTDIYGGSIENRSRLLMEVTEAVVDVWGADRVGVRLSPSGTFMSMADSNLEALFNYVVSQLDRFNLAYLHIVEPRIKGDITIETDAGLGASHFRSLYAGTIITAGGYRKDTGNRAIQNGDADLVAYGRLFIANPDLPKRFATNAPLNQYDRSTFYGGTARGYTDYPFLEDSFANS